MKDSNLVYWLKKLLYGLKQSPWDWYEKIDYFFVNLGLKHCESDYSVYVLHVEGNTSIFVVYIDDLILTGNKPDLIFWLKRWLSNTFEMIDLGLQHFFLGLQVLPHLDGIFISQFKNVSDVLKCFKMDDYKACATPFQLGVKLTKYCESP